MGLRQSFHFKHLSREDVRAFLRQQFVGVAALDDRTDFFVFAQLPGRSPFTFDCELVQEGIRSDRAGEYFWFLGTFIEALTAYFGPVEVADI